MQKVNEKGVKNNSGKRKATKRSKKFNLSQRDIMIQNERLRFLKATETYEELLFSRIGLNSGLRLAEIINLQPRDIIHDELIIRVRQGKGDKSRWANVDLPTCQMLRAYANEKGLNEDDYFFTKSNRTYQRMVEDVAKRAGITRIKVTPHILRHTNITLLIDKGMPIEKVKIHAGHEDIGTTQIYTHLTYQMVSRTYQEIMGE